MEIDYGKFEEALRRRKEKVRRKVELKVELKKGRKLNDDSLWIRRIYVRCDKIIQNDDMLDVFDLWIFTCQIK